jgi:hypothetical protein
MTKKNSKTPAQPELLSETTAGEKANEHSVNFRGVFFAAIEAERARRVAAGATETTFADAARAMVFGYAAVRGAMDATPVDIADRELVEPATAQAVEYLRAAVADRQMWVGSVCELREAIGAPDDAIHGHALAAAFRQIESGAIAGYTAQKLPKKRRYDRGKYDVWCVAAA